MQQNSINIPVHYCEHRLVSAKDPDFAHFLQNSSNTHAACSCIEIWNNGSKEELDFCFLDFEIPRSFAFPTGTVKLTFF